MEGDLKTVLKLLKVIFSFNTRYLRSRPIRLCFDIAKRGYTLVIGLLLFSCTETKIDNQINEDCYLLSFEILNDKNKIEESIHFTAQTDTLQYSGSYLKWISGDKPDLMIPSFAFKGNKVLLNGVEVISGVTEVSFADDVVCEIIGERGTVVKKYVISLTCPQINKELPVLRLNIDSKDIVSKEEYLQAEALLYDHSDTTWHYSDGAIKIRGRGNSTWTMPKKPYRIKFPKKVAPIGFTHTKAKDWVILAHDMDKSLIRNHIAFKMSEVLFNKSDIFHLDEDVCFTPHSKFVNVYFGNQYHGVYQFVDHKEQGKGRIDIDKLVASDGDDSSVICGGHLLETVCYITNPITNFITSKGILTEHLYPKEDDHAPAQWKYIEDYLNKAEEVLYGDKFDDPEEGWRKFFDERSLADYIIVKELAQDMDGYISTYIYKKRTSEKLFFGPVWDVDKGWGNDIRVPFPDYPPMSSLMIYGGFRMCNNPDDWYGRFWNDANFRKLVSNRWSQKKEELITTIVRELDTLPLAMAKSIKANYMVWPFDIQNMGDAPQPEPSYEEEIEKIRRLTYERVRFLDTMFQ